MTVDLSVGAVVAGYSVEAVCGRGGMSVVYRAEDTRLHRKVALKVITPRLADDAGFRSRFLRETQLAASLDHPHVIPVYDAGEENGVLFMVMRYVDGADLRSTLHEGGPIPLSAAVAVASAVADALGTAHRHGLVHRDVKPGNVLLARGQGVDGSDHVYLADFGLARSSGPASGSGSTGELFGTIAYMAPEQIRGEPAAPATDVYGLGCVLLECLTGAPPFVRDLDVAVLWGHLHDEPPTLAAAGVPAPPELDRVLARSLAKDPRERFTDADEFHLALREAVGRATAPLRLLGKVSAGATSTESTTADRPPGPAALPRPRPLPEASQPIAAPADAAGSRALGAVTGSGSRHGRPRPLSARLSRRTRFGSVATALVAAAVGAAMLAGVPIGGTRGPPSGSVVPSDTVASIDPVTLAVSRPVGIGRGPSYLAAAADGRVWAANAGDDTVQVIDEAGRVLTGGDTGHPTGVAVGTDAVWVSAGLDGDVVRIDPATAHVDRRVPVGVGLNGLAVDDSGGVWVADAIPGTVVHVDGLTLRADRSLPVGRDPRHVALGVGSLWVTDGVGRHLVRFDLTSGARLPTIGLRFMPDSVVIGAGSAWVTHPGDDVVSRVDPATNSVTATIPVGDGPGAVAYGENAVWVANSQGTSVSRIDPRTLAVQSVELGNHPVGLAVVGGRVYVSVSAD